MQAGTHHQAPRCRRRDGWLRATTTLVMAVYLLAAVVAVMRVDALQRRKEIDYDALEKSWAADDASQELRSEADDQFDKLSKVPAGDAKALGPQMVFVTLRTQEPLSELATRWKEMLWNGRVDVTIYEIEAAKVLIGLQKGIFMNELRAFLKEQDEVKSYEWESRTYTREDPLEIQPQPTRPRRAAGKKKKEKKTKKTKKTEKTTLNPHQEF